ncbi:SPFH domain-containing protein [Pigmentibacter ruber]|uniref:SPFH domain-containing protein n=1 Tax=Pigmentibacter ruber TaxID=2683196 RepID=UPI00131C1797|nr:SPFH domain-containing protein [Pigmentibacter ruber]BFD31377.1 hypothetical protein GTC16762_09950 [Pigmentibacter ruber]
MNINALNYVIGIIAGCLLIPFIIFIFRNISLQVENETQVLLCRFGKFIKAFDKPGLYFQLDKLFPWVKFITVSLKKDFRCVEEIHVNDRRGTTIIVDLFYEFKIFSPTMAAFQIENIEKFMHSTVISMTTTILGTFEFKYILENRDLINNMLKEEIKNRLEKWGINLETAFLSRISLLSEVSQQLFDKVSAQLEKTKADIEENGKLAVQLLEAQTAEKISELVAEAKGQYSLSVSEAYQNLIGNKEIFEGYKKLYTLSLQKAHRSIVFQGFDATELTSVDSAMTMVTSFDDTAYVNGPKVSELTSSNLQHLSNC